MIDVTLPLCRGRLITMENGAKHWIRFKYERLPNLCLWCGRLTHNDKNCELWIESKGILSPDQQQFSSSLKAAPYSAKGKDVIFILRFYEGRKSSFRRAKEIGPCPALVVDSSGTGSSENIQSDMEVTVEEGSNECRDPLNAETVCMWKTLQTKVAFTPNGKSVSNESRPNSNQIPGEENINSEILLPKSISSTELFDIQIREIDEALIKFGKHTDGEINAKAVSNAEITPQNQCDKAKEGSGAHEVGLAQARGQLQGSGGVHAQFVQQITNIATPKKTYTRGGRKYQACARVVKKKWGMKISMWQERWGGSSRVTRQMQIGFKG